MDYNKLAKEIHQDQKKAGWYDEYRSDNTLILLIKSELFEAFEAYRKNPEIEALKAGYLEVLLDSALRESKAFVLSFQENVKDSFADELADMVIRLLDFAGYKNLYIPIKNGTQKSYENVLEALVYLDTVLTGFYTSERLFGEAVFYIISVINDIAYMYKINLEKHIKLKLAYNKTRGKRHGNKAV